MVNRSPAVPFTAPNVAIGVSRDARLRRLASVIPVGSIAVMSVVGCAGAKFGILGFDSLGQQLVALGDDRGLGAET